MQGTRVKGRAGNRSRHALLYSLLGAKEPMPKDGFIPTIGIENARRGSLHSGSAGEKREIDDNQEQVTCRS